jgi:hypothetical protein
MLGLGLVAAGHFGGGVAELLLHIAFIDLGRRGEAGARRCAVSPTAAAQPVAPFVDEAHDLHGKTLIGLKRAPGETTCPASPRHPARRQTVGISELECDRRKGDI